MSFLQPWLLAALPLIALPIIIHLINQRRYQTVRWGAMMFLLAANRMSRGYARIRQWLIMAFRMLAIAGLVFAVSRPLATGWLGLAAGGKADTTIVLLDRSPSMQEAVNGSGSSKLEAARRQLVQTLETLGSSRWVLIDSVSNTAHELDGPAAFLQSPHAAGVSASADLPAMLQTAYDYIQANQAGRTEIWICSDVRENDWSPSDGRWQTLQAAFSELVQQCRIHLLAFSEAAPGNQSVRVTDVRRLQGADGAELLLSLLIRQQSDSDEKRSLPLHFEIGGARSEETVEFAGDRHEIREYRLPLESSQEKGWGRVSIPADVNGADNDYFFVFDRPAPRHAVIVADDPQVSRTLQLAASIPPFPELACQATIVPREELGTVDWNQVGLVIWQAPLPDGADAALLTSLLDAGRQLLFFPPAQPGTTEFAGVRWGEWSDVPEELAVESWRGDQGFLSHTQSGAALPVGELQVRRICSLEGDVTSLARLRNKHPLLARVAEGKGNTYFCATTPALSDSSLATEGVVLYILVQRALSAGALALGTTRQLVAGLPDGERPADWQRLAGDEEALSAEYAAHRGVYSTDERLLGVNRALAEDMAPVLAEHRVAELFRGLDFDRVEGSTGNSSSLVREIWRLFLTSMIVALIVEAALCLPRPIRPEGAAK